MATVKLKLSEMLELLPELEKLSEKELSAKESYWISKLLRRARSEQKTFDMAKIACVKRHGEELPDQPGQWRVKLSNVAVWNDEMDKLLQIEVELDNIALIDFAWLEKLQLAPGTLAGLAPLLINPPSP